MGPRPNEGPPGHGAHRAFCGLSGSCLPPSSMKQAFLLLSHETQGHAQGHSGPVSSRRREVEPLRMENECRKEPGSGGSTLVSTEAGVLRRLGGGGDRDWRALLSQTPPFPLTMERQRTWPGCPLTGPSWGGPSLGHPLALALGVTVACVLGVMKAGTVPVSLPSLRT